MKKIVLSILIPVIVFGACFGIARSLSGSKQSSGSPEGAASAASGTTGNTEGAAGSAGGAFVRDKYIDSENAENVLILIYDVKKGSNTLSGVIRRLSSASTSGGTMDGCPARASSFWIRFFCIYSLEFRV